MKIRKTKWIIALIFIALLIITIPAAYPKYEEESERRGVFEKFASLIGNGIQAIFGNEDAAAQAKEDFFDLKSYILVAFVFITWPAFEPKKYSTKMLILGTLGLIMERGPLRGIKAIGQFFGSWNIFSLIENGSSLILFTFGIWPVVFGSKNPFESLGGFFKGFKGKGGGAKVTDEETDKLNKEREDQKTAALAHADVASKIKQIFDKKFKLYRAALVHYNSPKAAAKIGNDIVKEVHALVPEEKRALVGEMIVKGAARRGVKWLEQ